MAKKLFALAVIVAFGWYFLNRTSLAIPKSVKFNNSTYQLKKSDTRAGALIGYYFSRDNTLEDFEELIMVTAWPPDLISFADFDQRFRTAIGKGMHGKAVADNGDDDSCWVVKGVHPPQTIDVVYLESSESFVQASFTRVIDQQTDTPNCSDHSSIVRGLTEIVDW